MLPRVSVKVSYNRRWFGNFFVTDNTRTTAADYDRWTVPSRKSNCCRMPAPPPRFSTSLPAESRRGVQNYQTFETDFAPARTQYWHGMNVNLNARLRNGLTIQGGTATGRGVRNTCDLFAALPELLSIEREPADRIV